MFLDEEIVQIVLNDKPMDEESEKDTATKVIKLCLKALTDRMNEDLHNPVAITKQVCNSWDMAAKTLIKKGFPFLKEGGFKAYILSKPGIKETLEKAGFK